MPKREYQNGVKPLAVFSEFKNLLASCTTSKVTVNDSVITFKIAYNTSSASSASQH